jgi:hypothetical protein
MISKIKNIFIHNKKIIILTFEIFWIVVFLLERIGSENVVEIPQFVYVNF